VAGALGAVAISPVQPSGPLRVDEELTRPEVPSAAHGAPRGGPGAGAVVRPPGRRRRGGSDDGQAEDAHACARREEQRSPTADHRAALEPSLALQTSGVVAGGDLAPAHRVPPRIKWRWPDPREPLQPFHRASPRTKNSTHLANLDPARPCTDDTASIPRRPATGPPATHPAALISFLSHPAWSSCPFSKLVRLRPR
jgi:hypothetical protein